MLVAITDIRVGKRLRSLRENAVADLMSSISELGLQTPISVKSGIAKCENGGSGVAFDLIAGLHRLEACRRLGWAEIEASVSQLTDTECELWEIDENLRRSELNELERGEHLLKRKVLYEKLHPETKAGAAQAVGMHQSLGHNVGANLASTSFSSDAAVKTGTSKRAVQRSVQRAKKIDSKVRDRIRGNAEIANSGAELDALASLDPQQQAVKMVEAGKAKTVREARTRIASRAPKPPKASSKEAQIRAMRESLATAPTRPIGQLGQAFYRSSDQERDKAADELVQVLVAEIEQMLKVLSAIRAASHRSRKRSAPHYQKAVSTCSALASTISGLKPGVRPH